MVWLLSEASSKFFLENEKQTTQKNLLKCFEFGQKKSCSKVQAFKDGTEKNVVAETMGIKKTSTLERGNRKKKWSKDIMRTIRTATFSPENWKHERL